MDMKKIKPGDFDFSSKVSSQQISFGSGKANYRDRVHGVDGSGLTG